MNNMYVYIYIYTHVFIYVCVCIHVSTCIYTYIFTYIYIFMFIHVYICINVFDYIFIHMYWRTNMYIYIYTYLSVQCSDIYMYAHTYNYYLPKSLNYFGSEYNVRTYMTVICTFPTYSDPSHIYIYMYEHIYMYMHVYIKLLPAPTLWSLRAQCILPSLPSSFFFTTSGSFSLYIYLNMRHLVCTHIAQCTLRSLLISNLFISYVHACVICIYMHIHLNICIYKFTSNPIHSPYILKRGKNKNTNIHL